MRILLARARDQGHELAIALSRNGHEVWYFEAVDFAYLGDSESNDVGVNVVFPSATAVRFFAQYIEENRVILGQQRAFCVGPTTLRAAEKIGFQYVFSVDKPPFDSDALYDKMEEAKALEDVSIVTSMGGRRVIQQKLDAANKKYNELVLYQRIIHQSEVEAIKEFAPQCIVASSYDVWRGAKFAIGCKIVDVQLIIVPSKRIKKLVETEVNAKVLTVERLRAGDISTLLN